MKHATNSYVSPFSTVFKNEYIEVAKARVKFPHKQFQSNWWFFLEKDVVQIVALTSDRKVILNRQWRPGARRYVMEFPAGYIEKNDRSIIAAGQRELLEETGYRARKIKRISTLYVSPTNQPAKIHILLATDLKFLYKTHGHDATEYITNRLIPLSHLPLFIRSGKLNCLSSVAAAYVSMLNF